MKRSRRFLFSGSVILKSLFLHRLLLHLPFLHLSVIAHLQDEDKIVHRFVSVEEVVLHCSLILLVIFQLLDDVGVLQ